MLYILAHPIQVGWTAQLQQPSGRRTVSAAPRTTCACRPSGIIASNIYSGERRAAATVAENRVLRGPLLDQYRPVPVHHGLLRHQQMADRSRDARWNANDRGLEGPNYVETTRDEGNKRLDFRFAPDFVRAPAERSNFY